MLGIDPGQTVGWSYGYGNVRLDSGEYPYVEFLRTLDLWLTTEEVLGLLPIERIAVERFDLRTFTNDAKLTVEVIGAINYLASKFEVPINYVTASARLKYRDQRIAGRHERDAEAVRLWDTHHGRW